MLENIKRGINFTKSNYELSKKNNDLDRFRGDEISYRISQVAPLNAQIALNANLMKDLINGTTYHFKEFQEHEAIREEIKLQVDAEITAFETNTNIYHGA